MISFTTPSLLRRLHKPLALVAGLGLFALGTNAQTTLLSHYTLDGNGTDGGSVGADGAPNGTGSASYVSGGVGKFGHALSTTGGTQDYFVAPTANNTAFGLSAITVAMWVNIDSGVNDERLLSNLTTSSGFDLRLTTYSAGTEGAPDTFNLAFGFNSTSGAVQASSANYVSDQWIFVAVTYDSTISEGPNVSFYSGNETTSLGLDGTGTKSNPITFSSSALEIGGTPASGSDRTPVALFNDVRIYDGALTAVELEAIRASALSTIPEPSQSALISGALLIGFAALRRRQR